MKFPRLSAIALFAACLSISTALAYDRYPFGDGDGDHFPPPPTNASPTVQIVHPREGAMVLVGDNVYICAETSYFTDTVASVEFFAGTNSLGVVSNTPSFWGEEGNFFCLVWSNVTAGAYTLTAVATDAAGNMATSAGVDISVVTDLPPRIHIISPRSGALILGPTNITICAQAFDLDGTVTNVEFFQGTTSLGSVSNTPTPWGEWGSFYCLTWSNVPPGDYTLTAVATDNSGASTTSDAVGISVVTNLPPRVRIETPEDGAMFIEPANIGICAEASDPDGTVTSVEFFEGTTSLGVVTTPTLITNWWHVEALYCLTWSNAPGGTYALTAVATDDGGATTTSDAVNITVGPPPPPSVHIFRPRDGATIYNAPIDISVCAFERNFTNPIVNVQFFAGTNIVGTTSNAPFSCIDWSQVQPGTYSLTAAATDSMGNTVTSAAVGITVTAGPGPHHPRHEWDQ